MGKAEEVVIKDIGNSMKKRLKILLYLDTFVVCMSTLFRLWYLQYQNGTITI